MSDANAKQVGGTHYKGTKVEHWDYATRTLKNRYFESATTKYIARHMHKNGKQDVEKAIHYCEKLLEEAYAGRVQPLYIRPWDKGYEPSDFCDAYKLSGDERSAVLLLSYWSNLDDLERALEAIKRVLDVQYNTPLEQGGAGRGYVDQG